MLRSLTNTIGQQKNVSIFFKIPNMLEEMSVPLLPLFLTSLHYKSMCALINLCYQQYMHFCKHISVLSQRLQNESHKYFISFCLKCGITENFYLRISSLETVSQYFSLIFSIDGKTNQTTAGVFLHI